MLFYVGEAPAANVGEHVELNGGTGIKKCEDEGFIVCWNPRHIIW